MPSASFTPQLRPLSVGEVLDAGFRLLRHRFGTLMLCVLVPIVPLYILAHDHRGVDGPGPPSTSTPAARQLRRPR